MAEHSLFRGLIKILQAEMVLVFLLLQPFTVGDVFGTDNMELLGYEEIVVGENPDKLVVWLHGLGSDGFDFVPVARQLGLPEELGVRFIFPHAPQIPVTINRGYVMPAWYDVYATGLDRRVDIEGVKRSASQVMAIIEEQLAKGIDSKNVVVAGFSQGGAVAYQLVLSFDRPLGGLLAMSTYFATAETITLSDVNKNVPVLIQHGTMDSVVDLEFGKRAAELLQEKGYDVGFETYSMDHSVCAEQIKNISIWLQQIFR